MTFVLLDSEVERQYLMTNSTKVIWLDMGSTSRPFGMKTDYRSAALPSALPGPVDMRTCMYIYVRAQMCAWLNMRVCMRATDGRVDLNVCACVCARPCLHACDPVCEDGMIDARLDGRTDGLIDGLLNGCMEEFIHPCIWVLIRVVRQVCMYVGR